VQEKTPNTCIQSYTGRWRVITSAGALPIEGKNKLTTHACKAQPVMKMTWEFRTQESEFRILTPEFFYR